MKKNSQDDNDGQHPPQMPPIWVAYVIYTPLLASILCLVVGISTGKKYISNAGLITLILIGSVFLIWLIFIFLIEPFLYQSEGSTFSEVMYPKPDTIEGSPILITEFSDIPIVGYFKKNEEKFLLELYYSKEKNQPLIPFYELLDHLKKHINDLSEYDSGLQNIDNGSISQRFRYINKTQQLMFKSHVFAELSKKNGHWYLKTCPPEDETLEMDPEITKLDIEDNLNEFGRIKCWRFDMIQALRIFLYTRKTLT